MNAKQVRYFKIGLAVVLAIVFVAVVANSVLTISRSAPPPRPEAPHAGTPSPNVPPEVAQRAAPVPVAEPRAEGPQVQSETSKRAWPVFKLDEIIAYDPFVISKTSDGVAISKSQPGTAGDNQEAGSHSASSAATGAGDTKSAFSGRIHAVYQRGGQTAALVGSKTVRAGDQLEGGGKIVEVDQGGVVMEVSK